MIKGIIFDADGTLIDSMGIWQEVGVRYLKSLNIEAEPTLAKELFHLSMQEGCEHIKNHYNLNFSKSEIEDGMFAIISQFYREDVELKKGVKEFLEELHQRQIPMCVATSSDIELLKSAFTRLDIYKYFKRIFSCKEFNTNKREAYIYHQVADYMNTPPNQTVVIEDVIFAVKSAKSAGFITVGVSDATSINDRNEIIATADYFMEDYTDFNSFWNNVSLK